MDNIDVAWLAGLYEGEGTLVKQGEGWALAITMCDEDVVRRARSLTGLGTVTLVKKPEGWLDQYRWRIGARNDIAQVLGLIRPFLGARRGGRADEFFAWFESKPLLTERYAGRMRRVGNTCANGHEVMRGETCKACARDRQRKYRSRVTLA